MSNALFDVRHEAPIVKRGREVLRVDAHDRVCCWIVSPKIHWIDVHVVNRRTAVHFRKREECPHCQVEAPMKELGFLLIGEGVPMRLAFLQLTPLAGDNLLRLVPDRNNLRGMYVVASREQRKIRSPIRFEVPNKPPEDMGGIADESPIPTLLRLWNVRLSPEQQQRLTEETR